MARPWGFYDSFSIYSSSASASLSASASYTPMPATTRAMTNAGGGGSTTSSFDTEHCLTNPPTSNPDLHGYQQSFNPTQTTMLPVNLGPRGYQNSSYLTKMSSSNPTR